MQHDFIVTQWHVWPPLDSRHSVSEAELLSIIPKMLKRRLSPLARTVFCAASQCLEKNTSIATVFSSTHGELAKSFKMMEMIEAGEDISPTAFSLSVHNAIAGLFAMIYSNTQPTTVVAPGEEGIAAAFIEAIGILQEGDENVLMVLYDEPLVDFYPFEPFKLSTENRCAIALMLAKTGAGISLRMSDQHHLGDEGEQPLQVPWLIDFLAQDSQKQLQIKLPRHSWLWEKR